MITTYVVCALSLVSAGMIVFGIGGVLYLLESLTDDPKITKAAFAQYQYNLDRLFTVMVIAATFAGVSFLWSFIVIIVEICPWLQNLVY